MVWSGGSKPRIATTWSANRNIPAVMPQAHKLPTRSDATVSGKAGVLLKPHLFQTAIVLVLGKSLMLLSGDQQRVVGLAGEGCDPVISREEERLG